MKIQSRNRGRKLPRSPVTKDEAQVAETFLRLKVKSVQGVPWTADESATVELSLKREGDIRVLAGCCVLVSQRSEDYGDALEAVRKAIEDKNVSPYVELSIYEALIYVQVEKLAPFRDALFSFIEQSLARRTINLDNTIFLIGRLARTGDRHALGLLQSLAHDNNAEIRDNAFHILQGIERD